MKKKSYPYKRIKNAVDCAMDFHAARNYHNAYKKLHQLFDCGEYCEEDYDKIA